MTTHTPIGIIICIMNLYGKKIRLAASTVSLALSLFAPRFLPFDSAWIAIAICGVPIFKEAIEGLVKSFDVKADLLVAIAIVASLATGEVFAAGEVALIMALGESLEGWTVAKARRGIDNLAKLAPRTAKRILPDNTEEEIAAVNIQPGDQLRVRPGEAIPADGIIETGVTSIDNSALTGEPVPDDCGPGNTVMGGAINRFGSFDMVATKPGSESAVSRMLKLVESASAGKSRIVSIADRWATWMVAIALLSAVACWIITGEPLRAVTILVVFCPCALVLATPTAIIAAIGNAARKGIFVREGDAIERLATVKAVAFDKTGTLTKGAPEVVAVQPFGDDITEKALLLQVAAVESRSEHPLAKAIVRHTSNICKEPLPEPEGFRSIPGRGVAAHIGGRLVEASRDAEESQRVAVEWAKRGATVVHISIDGNHAGFIALSDSLREDAAKAVELVQKSGVSPILLTGDNAAAANEIAQSLGIKEIRAGCLPEDKLAFVKELEREGRPVCMVGDGVNDAPALKAAHAGIAVGGVENALAAEAADVAIVHGGLLGVPHLLKLANKTRKTIAFNMALSVTINLVAVMLAAAGCMNTVTGALVHNGGSIIVIANSARILLFGRK